MEAENADSISHVLDKALFRRGDENRKVKRRLRLERGRKGIEKEE